MRFREHGWLIVLAWFGFAQAVRLASAEPPGDAMPPSADERRLITPAEYLSALSAPKFRAGHGLPPLTRFGWTLPFDARIVLAERFGYALEFGGYADAEKVRAQLANPDSEASKLVALCASDPKRYPLAVICSRQLPKGAEWDVWTRDAEGRLLDAKALSLDGTEWNPGMKTVYSPLAGDEYWRQAGELRAEGLRLIRQKCPIAIVLNGGEYGLGVLGFAQQVWEKDPRIVAAKGDRPWFDYISERKAHFETLIAERVRAAAPDRLFYIYYTAGGGTHRNVIDHWRQWCHGWEWMKGVSDLPSNEAYYRHFNDGWSGKHDMLTLALNAAAREIADGKPLSYNWLCAGWERPDRDDGGFGDLDRYRGFLRCYYTAGMIGGNAGYYAYPKGGFGAKFPADQPPHWLRQMVVLAEVHAQFSHLEEYLREGDLLPGPDRHRISPELPAYELPTGEPNVRVLARKHRRRDEWLLVAWAAAGEARRVEVDVAGLGRVELEATPDARLYLARNPGFPEVAPR